VRKKLYHIITCTTCEVCDLAHKKCSTYTVSKSPSAVLTVSSQTSVSLYTMPSLLSVLNVAIIDHTGAGKLIHFSLSLVGIKKMASSVSLCMLV